MKGVTLSGETVELASLHIEGAVFDFTSSNIRFSTRQATNNAGALLTARDVIIERFDENLDEWVPFFPGLVQGLTINVDADELIKVELRLALNPFKEFVAERTL